MRVSLRSRAARPGKCQRQPVIAPTGCLPTGSRLVLTEQSSKLGFLVDTGADVCCFPRRLLPNRRLQVSDYTLSAANKSDIKTYGPISLVLNLGLRRAFS